MSRPVSPVCCLAIILSFIAGSACNRPQKEIKQPVFKDALPGPKRETKLPVTWLPRASLLKDTLLSRAATVKAMELDESDPFLSFRSGYILNRSVKNAFIAMPSSDSTFGIRLYEFLHGKWELQDSINPLEISMVYHDVTFKDYNFDGQNDIYIQLNASNGYVMSRGHLITIDPVSRKMILHPEARWLANMKPVLRTKTVLSDSLYDCRDGFKLTPCTVSNKWVKGKLTMMEGLKCDCDTTNKKIAVLQQ